jgi:hypothetical protein
VIAETLRFVAGCALAMWITYGFFLAFQAQEDRNMALKGFCRSGAVWARCDARQAQEPPR